VALIAAGSPALGDARLAAATACARARAEVGFAPVATDQRGPLVAALGARAADDVEVVARLMHAANMAANAMDALPARMRGRAPEQPEPVGRTSGHSGSIRGSMSIPGRESQRMATNGSRVPYPPSTSTSRGVCAWRFSICSSIGTS